MRSAKPLSYLSTSNAPITLRLLTLSASPSLQPLQAYYLRGTPAKSSPTSPITQTSQSKYYSQSNGSNLTQLFYATNHRQPGAQFLVVGFQQPVRKRTPYIQRSAMAPGLENGHATAPTNGHHQHVQHSPSACRTLILDLGDVLFHWSTRDLTALSPSTFHAVVLSPTWGLLECGRISEDDAISAIAAELGLSCDSIREAIRQCKGTLRVDSELVRSLMELKREMGEGFKVYAM